MLFPIVPNSVFYDLYYPAFLLVRMDPERMPAVDAPLDLLRNSTGLGLIVLDSLADRAGKLEYHLR